MWPLPDGAHRLTVYDRSTDISIRSIMMHHGSAGSSKWHWPSPCKWLVGFICFTLILRAPLQSEMCSRHCSNLLDDCCTVGPSTRFHYLRANSEFSRQLWRHSVLHERTMDACYRDPARCHFIGLHSVILCLAVFHSDEAKLVHPRVYCWRLVQVQICSLLDAKYLAQPQECLLWSDSLLPS
jgi:hypothetical protein